MHQQLKTGAPPASALPDYVSYEEFLELGEEFKHSEWVNGRVVLMPPVSDAHSTLKGDLYYLLRTFVDYHDLGIVKDEPFQMKTGPDLPGRSPDVFVVLKKNVKRLRKTFFEGPADLVVEVISPSTRAVDRGDKYYEYERGGVREYWLLDPLRKQAEFYLLGRDRIYRPVVVGSDNVYHSTVLKGLWINVPWLWGAPRLTLTKLLKEWGIQ